MCLLPAMLMGVTPHLPFAENFECSENAWAVYGHNHSWQWGAPPKEITERAHWGTKGWFVHDRINTPGISWIKSPAFDLSGSEFVVLEFYLHTNIYKNQANVSLQFSTDEGQTWEIPAPQKPEYAWNWQKELPTTITHQDIQITHGWQEKTEGWQKIRAVLGKGIAGQDAVMFRWVFFSAGNQGNLQGAGLDAVSIFEAPHDIGPTALWHTPDPDSNSGDYLVSFAIQNFGFHTLPSGTTIPVGYYLQDEPACYEVMILPEDLNPGATFSYTFRKTLQAPKPGKQSITVFTMLAGDTDFYTPGVFNDTLTQTLRFSSSGEDVLQKSKSGLPYKNQLFRVYPNPTQGLIYIETPPELFHDQISFELTDINGAIHYRKTFNPQTDSQLGLSHLSAGMYFLNLTVNNHRETHKFYLVP